MVAKDRTPSVESGQSGDVGSRDRYRLTHSGNDLCLKTELVLETTSEVADSTLAIGSDVRDFADVVEHVSAGK